MNSAETRSPVPRASERALLLWLAYALPSSMTEVEVAVSAI